MSAHWTAGGTNYLSHAPGGFLGTGAYTMALLTSPGSGNFRMMDWFASAAEKGQFLLDIGAMFGESDFTAGVTPQSVSGWQVYAISKAAGASVYRYHDWPWNSGGTGTMNHASTTGTHANMSPAATEVRAGFATGASAIGDIAVIAYWDRALSDAELDTLKSPNLSAWSALAPDFAAEYSAWSGTAGDTVFSASGGVATKTGTVTSAANPTGFNFTLAPPGPPFDSASFDSAAFDTGTVAAGARPPIQIFNPAVLRTSTW